MPLPISLGFGPALVTLLAALIPAAYVRVRDRHLERHRDDPALPELLLARQQQTGLAMLAALLVMLLVGRGHAAWGIPLLVIGLLAARHHAQRVLHGERWGLAGYLRYHLVAIIGGFGFWMLLALVPTIVGAIAGTRRDTALAVAALLAVLLVVWQRSF